MDYYVRLDFIFSRSVTLSFHRGCQLETWNQRIPFSFSFQIARFNCLLGSRHHILDMTFKISDYTKKIENESENQSHIYLPIKQVEIPPFKISICISVILIFFLVIDMTNLLIHFKKMFMKMPFGLR